MRIGKPAAGHLILSAEQQGNRILITLKDDGCGIDLAMLRAVAIQRRVAAASDIDRWSPEQLLDVIFQPGFSTRSLTTDVSGRGVGMDVVKSVVERLGGAVRVQSELDKGTSITLNLPLSLALLRVVLLEAGEELFALPTAAIRRILQVSAADIGQLQQGPVAEVDGENIPLTPLSAMLQRAGGAAGCAPDRHRGRGQRRTIRHPRRGGPRRAGAGVQGAARTAAQSEDIYRRGIARQRRHRADSRRQRALRARIARSVARRRSGAWHAACAPRIGRVLVVDDSLVAGELQKNILLAAGYESEIASDGVEALECLHRKEWDLVVADVDMPRMTGFELTERIRADEQFRDIPVIIVTSRDTVDDRRRGFEVGADAYVLKREFDQSQLLDTVRRLIGRATRQDSHV